jgi:hypothetical protein
MKSPPFEKREGWGSLGTRDVEKIPFLAKKTREKWGTRALRFIGR